MKRLPIVAALAIALSLAGCSTGNPATTTPDTSSGGGDAVAPSEAATDSESTSDSGSSSAQELPLGQPIEVKQSEGTAKVTIFSATYGPSMPGGDQTPVLHGGILMLDVQFEASEGVADANPFYFTVKSADGQDAEVGLGTPDAISAGPLQTGETRRGNVAFDVGAGPYELKIWDDLMTESVAFTVEATPR